MNAAPHDPSEFIGWSCRRRRCVSACTATRRGSAPPIRSRRSPAARRRRSRHRLRAVPRPRAQPREGRRDGICRIGHRPDRRPAGCFARATSATPRNGSVEPSDPEFTRVQGTTLMFSRCFTATGGATPLRHLPRPASRSRYRLGPLRRKMPRLPHLADGQRRALPPTDHTEAAPLARPGTPICPVNPATDCVSCHMPKVKDPSRPVSYTDHHIRIHRVRGG